MGMLNLHDNVNQPDIAMPLRIARRFVLNNLSRFPNGSIRVEEPGGGLVRIGDGEPACALRILDWRTYSMMFSGGGLGAGEAFMEGLWESDDLTAVVRYFSANIEPMQGLDGGLAKLAAPARRWLHVRNRNSLTGSKRNIAAHYDLGNDFFQLWLDPTMMYSSAVYPSSGASLEEASVHKLDLICKKLGLRPGLHLLEVGTGWGGLAMHAARHYGCKVTTTTISAEQHRYATERVEEAGLSGRVTVLDKDYRLLEGKYDRVVSVEMIEAVGHQFLPEYFRKLGELVKDDGILLLQAITVPQHRYQYALNQVDFIKRYIFPGGFLPSVQVMMEQMGEQSRLTPVHVEDIGLDYARTLAHWRERFLAAREPVLALGFDQRFLRMWEYYLCYCEGAFMERAISTVQLVAAGPACRKLPAMA